MLESHNYWELLNDIAKDKGSIKEIYSVACGVKRLLRSFCEILGTLPGVPQMPLNSALDEKSRNSGVKCNWGTPRIKGSGWRVWRKLLNQTCDKNLHGSGDFKRIWGTPCTLLLKGSLKCIWNQQQSRKCLGSAVVKGNWETLISWSGGAYVRDVCISTTFVARIFWEVLIWDAFEGSLLS